MKLLRFFVILIIVPSLLQAQKLKPIVIMHGINSNSEVWKTLENELHKVSPESYIKRLVITDGDKSERETSFINPFRRRDLIIEALNSDPLLQSTDIIGIAHSQGGLDLRAALQHNTAPHAPRFHTFISLGSPQAGFYGIPTDLDERLQEEVLQAKEHPTSKKEKLEAFIAWLALKELNGTKDIITKVFYSDYFQQNFSAAGYWKDPLKSEKYLRKCAFLPQLNNEIMHEYSAIYRDNIARVARFVFVRSDKDEVIEPSLSPHLCYYQAGSDNEEDIPKNFFDLDQKEYNKLGFTLAQTRFETVHCSHTEFSTDKNVLELIIKYWRESDEPQLPHNSELEAQPALQPSTSMAQKLSQWITTIYSYWRSNTVS